MGEGLNKRTVVLASISNPDTVASQLSAFLYVLGADLGAVPSASEQISLFSGPSIETIETLAALCLTWIHTPPVFTARC